MRLRVARKVRQRPRDYRGSTVVRAAMRLWRAEGVPTVWAEVVITSEFREAYKANFRRELNAPNILAQAFRREPLVDWPKLIIDEVQELDAERFRFLTQQLVCEPPGKRLIISAIESSSPGTLKTEVSVDGTEWTECEVDGVVAYNPARVRALAREIFGTVDPDPKP